MAVALGGEPRGGWRATVSGPGDLQRQILATGLVAGDSGPLGRARQGISARASRLRFPSPPAGIGVRGNLQIGPGVAVDASEDEACGNRAGTWSSGMTSLSAGSQVRGRGGDPTGPHGALDVQQDQDLGAFEERAFDGSE